MARYKVDACVTIVRGQPDLVNSSPAPKYDISVNSMPFHPSTFNGCKSNEDLLCTTTSGTIRVFCRYEEGKNIITHKKIGGDFTAIGHVMPLKGYNTMEYRTRWTTPPTTV